MTPAEVAGAALACPPLVRAIRLAEWVGDSRELTGTGVLRPALAVQACQALGIELPPGKLRSAKDVADLSVAWEVAVAADLVRVAARLLSGSYADEATEGELFQLKVTLRGVSKPPVWRRILVPVTMSLGELHEVIVRAMGWHGGHLHVFSDGMFQYGSPDAELGYRDEDDIELGEVLSDPGDKLRYTYDFGDDWEHDIRLEKVVPSDAATPGPTCLAGKGACPPEDCGGVWGYASLKEAVADPDHEQHQELFEWLGLDDPSDFDPTAFNLDYANARVSGAGLSGLGVGRLRVRCRARRDHRPARRAAARPRDRSQMAPGGVACHRNSLSRLATRAPRRGELRRVAESMVSKSRRPRCRSGSTSGSPTAPTNGSAARSPFRSPGAP